MTPSYGATTSTCAPTPCTWNSPANPSTKSGNDPVLERDHCKTTVIPAYTGIQRGRATETILRSRPEVLAFEVLKRSLSRGSSRGGSPVPFAKRKGTGKSEATFAGDARWRRADAAAPVPFAQHNATWNAAFHSQIETKTTLAGGARIHSGTRSTIERLTLTSKTQHIW